MTLHCPTLTFYVFHTFVTQLE